MSGFSNGHAGGAVAVQSDRVHRLNSVSQSRLAIYLDKNRERFETLTFDQCYVATRNELKVESEITEYHLLKNLRALGIRYKRHPRSAPAGSYRGGGSAYVKNGQRLANLEDTVKVLNEKLDAIVAKIDRLL